MNIISVVPARGGSKCIHQKNIILLGGKHLIGWTNEQEKNIALDCGAEVIARKNSFFS